MQGITFKSSPLTPEIVSALWDEWTDLADAAIERNVFLFPSFIRASLQLLSHQKPIVVTVYEAGHLIGLTIMQSDFGYARLPIRFYRCSVHYHQYLATPLIRKGCAKEFFAGIGRWIDTTDEGSSFCLFDLMSGDTEILRAALEIFTAEQRPTLMVDEFERAAILGPTYSQSNVDQHISKSRVKDLRRRRKRLSELGSVSIERCSEGQDTSEWFEDFLCVENSSWKGKAKTSIIQNMPDLAFYREMIASAETEYVVSFMRLTIDGVAIAYTLDLVSGPFVFCLKSAHDARYRKYAPGVILEYETLQQYHPTDQRVYVDSCTSPTNAMINELWPHRKKIMALAFSKRGFRHELAFKSAMLLKQFVGKSGLLPRAEK